MSSRYSANQFESAFRSQRMQNWCESRPGAERPMAQEGHTSFIADDRGHLLPGVKKKGSAWPDFRGTWDLPAHIPARHINLTGRSEAGLRRLRAWGLDPKHPNSSETPGGSRCSARPQDAVESDDVAQEEGADPPSSAAAARPASEDRPSTTGSQNQDCETARSPGPDGGPADRALSSAVDVKPIMRSAAPPGPPGPPSSSRQRPREAEQGL